MRHLGKKAWRDHRHAATTGRLRSQDPGFVRKTGTAIHTIRRRAGERRVPQDRRNRWKRHRPKDRRLAWLRRNRLGISTTHEIAAAQWMAAAHSIPVTRGIAAARGIAAPPMVPPKGIADSSVVAATHAVDPEASPWAFEPGRFCPPEGGTPGCFGGRPQEHRRPCTAAKSSSPHARAGTTDPTMAARDPAMAGRWLDNLRTVDTQTHRHGDSALGDAHGFETTALITFHMDRDRVLAAV